MNKIYLKFQTQLSAPINEVWESITSMEGIRKETMPYFKMTAPKGISTTYPASAARLESIPAVTIENVMSCDGTLETKAFNAALINPERSATPIPSITTNTSPRGGKSVKTVTISTKILRIPSAFNKFTASIVSFVPG